MIRATIEVGLIGLALRATIEGQVTPHSTGPSYALLYRPKHSAKGLATNWHRVARAGAVWTPSPQQDGEGIWAMLSAVGSLQSSQLLHRWVARLK